MIKKVLKIITVIMLIVSSILLLGGCKNKSNEDEISQDVYLKPLRAYLDGLKNRDLAQVLTAYPEFMHMDTVIKTENIDELYSQYEKLYGANIQLEYEFTKITEVEQEDRDNLAAQISKMYSDAGEIKIEKAFIVSVDLTIKGDGLPEENAADQNEENKSEEEKENSNKDSSDFYVYELNGNWYIA